MLLCFFFFIFPPIFSFLFFFCFLYSFFFFCSFLFSFLSFIFSFLFSYYYSPYYYLAYIQIMLFLCFNFLFLFNRLYNDSIRQHLDNSSFLFFHDYLLSLFPFSFLSLFSFYFLLLYFFYIFDIFMRLLRLFLNKKGIKNVSVLYIRFIFQLLYFFFFCFSLHWLFLFFISFILILYGRVRKLKEFKKAGKFYGSIFSLKRGWIVGKKMKQKKNTDKQKDENMAGLKIKKIKKRKKDF